MIGGLNVVLQLYNFWGKHHVFCLVESTWVFVNSAKSLDGQRAHQLPNVN